MSRYGTYEHSGSLGYGLVAVPLVGAPFVLLLAWGHAYATVYSPIEGWLSIVSVAVFAVLCGLVAGVTVFCASVRNSRFAAGAGVALGVVAGYADWAAFEAVLLAKDAAGETPGYLELLGAPGRVWEIRSRIAEAGWYSIASVTPSGSNLRFLWQIEMVAVVVACWYVPSFLLRVSVYCERCGEWCDRKELLRFRFPNDERVLEEVCAGSVNALERLGALPGRPGPGTHLGIETTVCEKCGDTAAMVVHRIDASVDEKGKSREEAESLTPYLLVDGTALARLDELAGVGAVEAP